MEDFRVENYEDEEIDPSEGVEDDDEDDEEENDLPIDTELD